MLTSFFPSQMLWIFKVFLLCSLDTLTKLSPAPGLLHLIFPISGMLLPDLSMALLLVSFRSLLKYLLTETFFITILNHSSVTSLNLFISLHFSLEHLYYQILYIFYLFACLLSVVPTRIASLMMAGTLDGQCLNNIAK